MMPLEVSEAQLQQMAQALKKAREDKAESVADAAFKIALSPAQIKAIESADLKPFYNTNYFLQAARRYADFLGISLDYPSPHQPEPKESPAPADSHEPQASGSGHEPKTPQPTQKNRGLAWAAGAITTSIAAFVALQIFQEPQQSPQPPAPSRAEEPPVLSPASASQAKTESFGMQTASAGAPGGSLSISSATWVQVVLNTGEKQNTRVEPGQKLSFEPAQTAALVFGKPEQAELSINGKRIDLAPFILAETPSRALVLISKLR